VQGSNDALKFQEAADATVHRGQGHYDALELSSGEWLGLARFFIMLTRKLITNPKVNGRRFLASLGIESGQLSAPVTGLAFEMLEVHERTFLLSATTKLIACDSVSMRSAAQKTQINLRSYMDFRYAPSAIAAEIILKVNRPPASINKRARPTMKSSTKPKSKLIVLRKWARLKRKYARAVDPGTAYVQD